jgi:toxin YoeB
MRLVFTDSAWNDYLWFQANDRKLLKRINLLIKDCQRDPYDGLGKPERLKADLTGFLSRRIDDEHRLVYKVDLDDLLIVACRFHYES